MLDCVEPMASAIFTCKMPILSRRAFSRLSTSFTLQPENTIFPNSFSPVPTRRPLLWVLEWWEHGHRNADCSTQPCKRKQQYYLFIIFPTFLIEIDIVPFGLFINSMYSELSKKSEGIVISIPVSVLILCFFPSRMA